VAATVETSELKVPPQMRSVQVGSMLGALPALAAHGMMSQSPLHELGPTEPTIEVTWFWPVVCPLRLNERDLLLTANTPNRVMDESTAGCTAHVQIGTGDELFLHLAVHGC
jgi:hypothetical protein